MRYRPLLAALAVALAFGAAACGGGGDSNEQQLRRERGRQRLALDDGDLGRRGADVVPGRDRRVQEAVPERGRQVHVRRRQPGASALHRGQGGKPPDIAALGQPGLVADFAKKGAIKPIDDLKSQIVDAFGDDVAKAGRSTASSTP